MADHSRLADATLKRASEGVTMSQSRQMAHLTKDLVEASAFRSAAVDAMRDAAKSVLSACADMRGEMVREYRARTQKYLSSLSRNVESHRNAMAHQVIQTQKMLGIQARDVAARRNIEMNKIARVDSARRKAAGQMRSRLERQVDTIVMQVAELRDAAAEAVSELAKTHRKMAKQQKTSLKSGRQKLHTNTRKFVSAIHADRMKAQDIWTDFKLGKAA
jgi:hypothetical protein